MNFTLKMTTAALVALSITACQDAKMTAPAATTAPALQAAPAAAAFDWFSYEGRDPEFAAPLTAGTYQNPVLAGYFQTRLSLKEPMPTAAKIFIWQCHLLS